MRRRIWGRIIEDDEVKRARNKRRGTRRRRTRRGWRRRRRMRGDTEMRLWVMVYE